MSNGADIIAHAAEVLRQIEGARVVEGGGVGGGAWCLVLQYHHSARGREENEC
jgi:hypothetical protein